MATATIEKTQTNLDWARVRADYKSQITAVEGLLQGLEVEKEFLLSAGALEVLLIPIVQLLEERKTFDENEIKGSLEHIFTTMKVDPIEGEKGLATRSAISAMKAVAVNWCRVPPFCRK